MRHLYYSDQWQVVEERVGSDPDPADQYVWGLRYVDELILRDRDTATTPDGTFDQRHYYLQDANWNVTAITDHTGAVQERYVYDPYGQVSFLTSTWGSSSSSFANPYLFTGRRLDPETGLYHYRNRYYHAQLGRFVSRDPIGYGGGQSLYQYVSARPNGEVDLTGFWHVQLANHTILPCGGYKADLTHTAAKKQNIKAVFYVQKLCIFGFTTNCLDPGACCTPTNTTYCNTCCYFEFLGFGQLNGENYQSVTDNHVFAKFSDPGCTSEGSLVVESEVRAIDALAAGIFNDYANWGEGDIVCNSGCRGDITLNMGPRTTADNVPAWWNNGALADSRTVKITTDWDCCERERSYENQSLCFEGVVPQKTCFHWR